MHENVLPTGTRGALEQVARVGVLGPAYLAGGSALALQLGHRISFDLDFFSPEKFDELMLQQRLEPIGWECEQQNWQTVLGFLGHDRIKFSYFYFPYPLVYPTVDFLGVPLADVRDIAAMKMEAIGRRGLKRDFIDLYVCIKDRGLTMLELFSILERKFGDRAVARTHVLRSLSYFADADADTSPLRMLQPIDWNEVKRYFEREAIAEARKVIGA